MLFCSDKYKCIFFFPPGCACTFYKKWFYAIHNIIADKPHSLQFYEEFKVNWQEVFRKMEDENYNFILLVRNPYTRIYSNLKRKIIKNDTMENIYDKLKQSGDPTLKNVFDYFITYVDKDVEKINFKHIIDFIVDKNEHEFAINNSFKPITTLVNEKLFDNKNLNIFKLEDPKTFEKIHNILGLKYVNVKYKHLNKSNYRVVTEKFSDTNHLLRKIEDNRSMINYSLYYRKSIYTRFKDDFKLFNYDQNENINY